MGPILPGWRDEFGVDFSQYPIPGTSCSNCRSLVMQGRPTGRPTCMNPEYIQQSIPSQGKRAGDAFIPIASGNPSKYCCNVWAMADRFAT